MKHVCMGRMGAVAVVAAGVVSACAKPTHQADLGLDQIAVVSAAHLRTDTIGEGAFASQATFILVDAENRSGMGANVTLGGELLDEGGKVVATLNPESLWVGSHERRTFALVDKDRTAHLDAKGGRVFVRGAKIPLEPPLMEVRDVHTFADDGRVVIQGTLRNGATRAGTAMVIAAFYDRDDLPMKRPFSMTQIGGGIDRNLQFVGPKGSTRATLYVGDIVY